MNKGGLHEDVIDKHMNNDRNMDYGSRWIDHQAKSSMMENNLP